MIVSPVSRLNHHFELPAKFSVLLFPFSAPSSFESWTPSVERLKAWWVPQWINPFWISSRHSSWTNKTRRRRNKCRTCLAICLFSKCRGGARETGAFRLGRVDRYVARYDIASEDSAASMCTSIFNALLQRSVL